MIDIAKEYTTWLYENTEQNKINSNLIEVSTPFLDRYNDYTHVYIKFDNNGNPIEVNDYGETINELLLSGFEFSTNKRKEILNQIINRNGVVLSDEVLSVNVSSPGDLAGAKHRLIQAMLSINDMFVLSQNNIKTLFFEEVESYFKENEIYYSENINLTGKSNKAFCLLLFSINSFFSFSICSSSSVSNLCIYPS